MSRSLEDRIADLENDRQLIEANFRTLSGALRSRAMVGEIQDRDTAMARLSGGRLDRYAEGWRSGIPDRPPEFGMTLLDRLRNDASMSTASQHGMDDDWIGNLLDDPTFESLPNAPFTIPAARTAVGRWFTEYDVVSGSVTGSQTIEQGLPRKRGSGIFHNSATCRLTLTIDASSNVTFYIDGPAYVALDTLPFIVGSTRVKVMSALANVSSLTARVQIVDNAGVVLVDDDPLDLVVLADFGTHAKMSVAWAGPVVATTYRLRVRIDLVSDAVGAAQVDLDLFQPQMALSLDGATPPYAPHVGAWEPHALLHWVDTDDLNIIRVADPETDATLWALRSTATGVLADGDFEVSDDLIVGSQFRVSVYTPSTFGANQDDYDPGGGSSALYSAMRLEPTANVNITGFAGGVAGRIMYWFNVATGFAVTLTHNDGASLAVNRFSCPNGANWVLGNREGVMLLYDGTDSRWRLLARV